MPAIVKLSIEALAEAIASLNLEEKRQLQEILQQISEDTEVQVVQNGIATGEAVTTQPKLKSGTEFLILIAGIGSSDAEDISQRDEEILQAEIDLIHGWSIKPTQHS